MPKGTTYLNHTVVSLETPPCRTLLSPWGLPLHVGSVPPVSPRPTLCAWCRAKIGRLYKNQSVYPPLPHQQIVIYKPPLPWEYTTIKLYWPPEPIIYDIILICCYMAQLKHIPNNSILGRCFHEKVTPVNPTTCQNRESNHCTFKTVTILMINDGN